MVKISIVIPVYNMAQYIPCCLDSLAKQTLKEYEALCVDDGSTDDSVAVVCEYAKKDKRVRSIPLGKNMGVFAARNKALECATGEFIAFLDPDDWYPESDVLEDMYKTAKKNKVLICGGGWTNHYPDKPPQTEFGGTLWGLGCFKNPGIIEYKDYQFDFGYQRFIFSRKLLQDNKIVFPPYTRFQDPPFFVRAMHAAGRFYGMNRSTYNYRASYKQIDFSKRNYLKVRDLIRGLRDIIDYSRDNGLELLHTLLFDRCNNMTANFAEAIRHNADAFVGLCGLEFALDKSVLDRNSKRITSGKRPYIRPLQELFAEEPWQKCGIVDFGIIRKMSEYYAQYVSGGEKESFRNDLLRRIWCSALDSAVPKVSIVIPAYNVEQSLPVTLDSALTQTLKDTEIICVDDGSTDSTWEVLQDYAKRDPRIVLLRHKQNCGLYMARKTGIMYAVGRYVTTLDSDDTLFPDACRAAYVCAEETSADMVQGRLKVNNVRNFPQSRVDWIEKPAALPPSAIIGDSILLAGYVDRVVSTSVVGKLYSRKLALSAYVALINKRITMAEDLMASYALDALARKYVPLPADFYYYTYGTGITGREELTIDEFRKQCAGVDILTVLRKFRDNEAARHPNRWKAYLALRTRILNETFGRIGTFLPTRELQREGLEIFSNFITPLEFVKYLAERYFDNRGVPICMLDRLGYVPQVRSEKIRRIGFLYFSMTMGGVQRVMNLLAPVFHRLGYEVVFIIEQPLNDTCFKIPEDVTVVNLPQSQKCTASNIGDRLNQLDAIIRNQGIDMMYYHPYSSHIMQWDLLICKLVHRIPFVLHYHNCVGIGLYSTTRTPEISYLAAKMRMCDAVIALSRTDELFFSTQGVRAKYFPNPIDPGLRATLESDTPSRFDEKIVLWCARISWEKHPVDPVTIFASVRRKIPGAKLIVVGGGTAEIEDRIRRVVADKGLGDSVELVGNQVSAYPYYQKASLFLMTSAFEGFPMTLIEAGCYGLPTVAYDLPFLESVRGNAGIVTVPQCDTGAAAAAVVDILSNRAKYDEMSRANRAHMAEIAMFDQGAAWGTLLSGLQKPVEAHCPREKIDVGEVRILLEELQYCYANGFKARMSQIARLEKDLKVVRDATMPSATPAVSDSGKANAGNIDIMQAAKRVQILAREVESLKKSEAYRVGMFVTWPLRFIAQKIKHG